MATRIAQPGDPKNMCHWHCCQNQQTPETSLCVQHIELSKLLGLKVWPKIRRSEDDGQVQG